MSRGRAALGVLTGCLVLMTVGCTAATSTGSVRTTATSRASPESSVSAASVSVAAAAAVPPVHHQVVGLGDSVPAASHCDCSGFVAGAAQGLSQPGHPVTAVNLAVPGSTSTDLVQSLTGDRERSVIAASDVVLLEIGANDMDASLLGDDSCLGSDACWRGDLGRLDSNVRSILATLHRLRPSAPTSVVVLGYWNVGLSGDVGSAQGSVYVRNARLLSDAVNRLLQQDSAAGGALYVDAFVAFGSDDRGSTALLAADGDHPNAHGHDLLAAAVVSALRTAGR